MLTLYSHISSIPKYPLDFLRFSCDWNKKLNIARNRLSYSNVLGSNLGKMWNKSPQKILQNLSGVICFSGIFFFQLLLFQLKSTNARMYPMPGLRKDTVLVYNGYRYHKNKSTQVQFYWRCWRKECKGTMLTQYPYFLSFINIIF